MGLYGQVPGGRLRGDENCRPGYTGPRQGTETCTMVEMMHSHEMLSEITGDAIWADRCEDVAFNSLPASMTADLKALHYLTAPEPGAARPRQQVAARSRTAATCSSYSPYELPLLPAQRGPRLAVLSPSTSGWRRPRNGLAASLYAPASVTAKVGDGADVTIDEEHRLPVRRQSDRAVNLGVACRPFPARAAAAGVVRAALGPAVNGGAAPRRHDAARRRGWVTIDRVWNSGDRCVSICRWRFASAPGRYNDRARCRSIEAR